MGRKFPIGLGHSNANIHDMLKVVFEVLVLWVAIDGPEQALMFIVGQ